MNKIRPILVSVLVIICCIMMACKPNPKELISRKWKPVDASGTAITENIKDDIVKEGNLMEFTADGVFKSYTAGETPQTGKYTLNEEATKLIIQAGAGMETSMNIKELNHRKLVLETNGVTIVLEPAK
jgi:hypothetical protein